VKFIFNARFFVESGESAVKSGFIFTWVDHVTSKQNMIVFWDRLDLHSSISVFWKLTNTVDPFGCVISSVLSHREFSTASFNQSLFDRHD
jgi:hypothetical protein